MGSPVPPVGGGFDWSPVKSALKGAAAVGYAGLFVAVDAIAQVLMDQGRVGAWLHANGVAGETSVALAVLVTWGARFLRDWARHRREDGGGDRGRTGDLLVMSQASYRAAPPRQPEDSTLNAQAPPRRCLFEDLESGGSRPTMYRCRRCGALWMTATESLQHLAMTPAREG